MVGGTSGPPSPARRAGELIIPTTDVAAPRQRPPSRPARRRTAAIAAREADVAVRDRADEIGGTTLHWVEAGRGPTLLLVHGLGDTAATWRRVLPALARHHRVVAIDLPACGTSGPVTGHPVLPWLLDVLSELVDRVSPGRKVSVIGNSVGGALALRLALHHPRRTERVVLVDPAGAGHDVPVWWKAVRLQRAVRLMFGPFLALLPDSVLEEIVAQCYMRMAFHRPDRVDAASAHNYARNLRTHGDIDDFLERAEEVVDGLMSGLGRDPGSLRVPVLIVWGADDRLAPVRDAHVLRQRLPRAELRIIERCGHMPQLERPREFLEAVEPYLLRARRRG
jgi:pimeloyl-ACP methyl ester carboxylesterase